MIDRKAQIDDYNIGAKKTTKTKENYKIQSVNAENELLGLRTGLKTYNENDKP